MDDDVLRGHIATDRELDVLRGERQRLALRHPIAVVLALHDDQVRVLFNRLRNLQQAELSRAGLRRFQAEQHLIHELLHESNTIPPFFRSMRGDKHCFVAPCPEPGMAAAAPRPHRPLRVPHWFAPMGAVDGRVMVCESYTQYAVVYPLFAATPGAWLMHLVSHQLNHREFYRRLRYELQEKRIRMGWDQFRRSAEQSRVLDPYLLPDLVKLVDSYHVRFMDED